jgi:phosphate/sulfate permease
MSLEIIFFTVLLALIFDYTNGFHDAANVVSTVIATKAMRPFAAILMAGVLNTIGATQIGGWLIQLVQALFKLILSQRCLSYPLLQEQLFGIF